MRLGMLWLLLAALAFAVYWPALHGQFLWDDNSHVTRADLRSFAGLGRIWFEVGATQQYYPLLHSAFWLEHRLWGDAVLGYHIVNVLLHATAACLFAAVLRRLAVPGAWLAAVLFLVHPVCVESVAWISEQKNTLSAVLYLAAALAFLRWHGRPDPVVARASRPCRGTARATGETPVPLSPLAQELGRPRPLLGYLLASFVFLCALLTKTVTATLPAALLVLVWWQRGRLGWRRDVLPLLPWFVAGAASGLLTAWLERKLIGAEGADFELSLIERGLLAGRVVWFYLGKLVWPADLTFIYPRWEVDGAVAWQWLFPLATLGLLFALWRLARSGSAEPESRHGSTRSESLPASAKQPVDSRNAQPSTLNSQPSTLPSALGSRLWARISALSPRARRAPLAVALLFGGTLFPVLGFFNVYPFLYSFVADHFQYLASLGVFANAGAMLSTASRLATSDPAFGKFVRSESRRPDGLRRPAVIGPALVGVLLITLGTLAWRQSHLYQNSFVLFETTIARNPTCWMAYNNLGVSHAEAGRYDQALALYQQSLALNPRNANAENNLGYALIAVGRTAESVAHFRRALELQPTLTPVYNNVGRALMELGQSEEGLAAFAEAVRRDPANVDGHYNLGLALARLGRTDEALPHFQRATELDPGNASAELNWAVGLTLTDRFAEAEPHFRRSLALNPTAPPAHFAYGRALAENGRDEEAAGHLQTALAIAPEFALARRQLAQILRRLGRPDEAQFHENLIAPDRPRPSN